MAATHKVLPKNLTASHYYAMGKVSARWAYFEHMLLQVISDVSEIDYGNIGMLIGHASLRHWLDVLAMYVTDSEKHSPHIKHYNKLIHVSEMLYSLRNSVIHPLWTGQEGKRAKGMSLPKTGRKLFKEVDLSVSDMNAVARMIEASYLLLRVHHLLLDENKRTDYLQRLDLVHQTLCHKLDPKHRPPPSANLLAQLKTLKTRN